MMGVRLKRENLKKTRASEFENYSLMQAYFDAYKLYCPRNQLGVDGSQTISFLQQSFLGFAVSMAMKKPTIAIVSAGDMGSAVAERLSAHGARVLTDLSGRSQATKDRATACGMEHCSLDEVVRQSDWFLSIVPPKETENLAKAFVATVQDAASSTYVQQKDWRPPVFVDCNAKNPKTTLRLARLFSSVTTPSGSVQFLNASILGLPPKGDHNPTFYASAAPDPADQQILCNFEKLSIFGLRTKILCGEGSDICDASILKMTYSVRRFDRLSLRI